MAKFASTFFFLALMVGALHAFAQETTPLNDTEIWNAGVDAYRANDLTNAVNLLRPLLLSREYGPRAAEIVAAIAYDRACTPGATDALEQLEEAAAAAQIALRSPGDEARKKANFLKAVESLPALRETAHINKVIEKAQGRNPAHMLKDARDEARGLMIESAVYRTNTAELAVKLSDELSTRAETIADTWICIKELIAQSVTNEEEAATITMQVDQAKEKTLKGAKELADMDPMAYSSLADAEHDFTRFHKRIALPPDAIIEDAIAQSNAWQDVETINGRPWQQEALDYTRAFRLKFPAWAREYEIQAQADTNKPPFTSEAQAEISALSTELEKLQIECVKDILPPKQEQALEIIEKIRELLPKDNSGGASAGAQGTPQGGDDNKSQNPDGSDNQQNEGESENDSSSEERQEENPEQAEEKSGEAEEGEESAEKPDDREIEAILKKAQERADEHEAEKRARMRKTQLPPNERDW